MNATVKPEQCKTIRLCVCACVCVCHCSGAYDTHISSKVMLIFYVLG